MPASALSSTQRLGISQGLAQTHKAALKQRQLTSFTPQQQQAVRVLQLSAAALHDEISLAIETNPFLESDASTEAPSTADSTANKTDKVQSLKRSFQTTSPTPNTAPIQATAVTATSSNQPAASDQRSLEEIQAAAPSLHQMLREQANATPLSRIQHGMLDWLIDGVDSRGYLLEAAIKELEQHIPPNSGIDRQQIEQLISILQSFEPAGIGARNLRECLLIQLDDSQPSISSQNLNTIAIARAIIQSHLQVLATGNLTLLQTALEEEKTTLGLNIDQSSIKAAVSLIRGFNPHPGACVLSTVTQYIQPDVIVEKTDGLWQARLDKQALPQVSINPDMAAQLKQTEGQPGHTTLNDEYLRAKSLLENMQNRGQTLLSVAQKLVQAQQAFFDQGEVALKPLKLSDIAEPLECHASTISRTVNNKYMLTPDGLIELKALFSTALDTKQGNSIAGKAIRALIKSLIEADTNNKPLSDTQLADILNQRGIQIARRTVAKYREQLRIPASYKRKPFST